MSADQLPEYVPEPGYTLVYQSGHGDVWCNGASHVWTGGGYTGITRRTFIRTGRCDCKRWRDIPG